METAYNEFRFEVPIYGQFGPSHAHALVSVPITTDQSKPLPVIILLEGRAQLYEQDDSGRWHFDEGV
jgi:hypothetical protein